MVIQFSAQSPELTQQYGFELTQIPKPLGDPITNVSGVCPAYLGSMKLVEGDLAKHLASTPSGKNLFHRFSNYITWLTKTKNDGIIMWVVKQVLGTLTTGCLVAPCALVYYSCTDAREQY